MLRHLACVFIWILVATSSSYAKSLDSTKGVAYSTYALLISISSYPKEPSWPTANATSDISNLKAFVNKFDKNNSIQVLQDKSATKKNIIEKIAYITNAVSAGDNVFIHFSGGGLQISDDNKDEVDGQDEAFMPYDAPSFMAIVENNRLAKKSDLAHLIVDDELVPYIENIRKKLGPSGQFLFTIDASYFGPAESQSLNITGRGGFLEVSNHETGKAPFIMITACLEKQNSYFIEVGADTLNRSFSTALRNYSDQIETPERTSYNEFFAGFSKALRKLSPSQNPSISGDFANTFIFHNAPAIASNKKASSISKDARLFILAIGISNYTGPYDFANCDDDAILFTETLKEEFQKANKREVKTYQLLNEEATKHAIIKAINDIAIQAGDNDLFAFFFAGFTNQPEVSAGNFLETWFYPTTNKPVSIHNRDRFNAQEIISLSELKKLLDYLKCDKQLLFTEAGPSVNFKREFVRSMIKTNPVIADIVKRNRVIIVPNTFGRDFTLCNGRIDHGPGLYYFSKLKTEGVSIFDLFDVDKNKKQNVIYKYRQLQHQCNFPDYDYMSFFFEKEFVEDLQYYFTKEESDKASNKRGVFDDPDEKPLAEPVIKNKYALLIGTSKFKNFTELANPINDAKAISDTLSQLFGFKTKVLQNPGLGEIYKALYEYNSILKEDDQFVLYVAGHGYYDTTIYQDGFIVASDSRALAADTFLTSYVPFNQIRIITDNFKAKQVMVLLDVCFSGAFDNTEELLGGSTNYNLAYKLNSKTVNRKLQMVTRKYITAGSRIEEVPDNFKGGHSPFAWFLLEGLRRAAKEKKYISSGMLFKYIQAYLEDTAPLQSGYGKDQLRLGSEFIFMAN